MKNSGSGPKNAVSPMPVVLRYASALREMLRGSRVSSARVMGSEMLAIRLRVGSLVKGSITAESGSGMTSMSLLSIARHPRIDDPSKPRPSSKGASSLNSEIGAVKCCHVPSKSMNFTSTITAPLSLIIWRTCLGVIESVSLLAAYGAAFLYLLVDRFASPVFPRKRILTQRSSNGQLSHTQSASDARIDRIAVKDPVHSATIFPQSAQELD